MAISDEMVVKFSADISDLKAGLSDVKTGLSDVGDSARNISLVQAGESIKGFGRDLTQAVTLPVLGFFGESIQAASATEEAVAKFAQIFKGDLASAGEEWIAKTAGEMSRSSGQIRDFAAGFGALLSPAFQENKEKALELAEGYTTLAVDLAAFYDTTDQEAFVALRSGLAGEMEPLKRFGVLLTQDKVNAELMAMGVGKVTSALTASQKAELDSAQIAEDRATMTLKALEATGTATKEELAAAKAAEQSAKAANDLIQLKYKDAIASDKASAKQKDVNKIATDAEKAQARYNIVMRETTDAQGQAVRESDGYAQTMKALLALVDEIKIEVGMMLMPIVMSVLDVLKQGITFFKNIPGPIKTAIIIFAGLAAALGPVLVVIGTLVGMAGSLLVAIGTGGLAAGLVALKAFLLPLIAPILAIVAAIGIMIAALVAAYQGSETFREGLKQIASVIFAGLQPAMDWIIGGLKALWDAFKPVGVAIGDLIGSILLQVVDWLRGDGKSFIETLKTIGGLVTGALFTGLKAFFGYASEFWFPLMKELATKVLGAVLDGLTAFGDWFMSPGVQSALSTIVDILAAAFDALVAIGGAIGEFILDHVDELMAAGSGISKLMRGDVIGALGDFGEALGLAGKETSTAAKTTDTNMKKISASTDREMKAALKTVDENAVKIKDRLKKEYEANVANVDEQMRLARLGMENELGLTADTAEDGGKAIKDRLKEQYVANVENADQEFDAAKKKIETRLDETDKKVVQPKGKEIQTSMSTTWGNVNTETGSWWDTIRATVGTWVENVRLKIDGFKQGIMNAVGSWWSGIADGVWNGWVPIINKVSEMVGKIPGTIRAWTDSVVAAAKSVWKAAQDQLTQPLNPPVVSKPLTAAPGLDINKPTAIIPMDEFAKYGGKWDKDGNWVKYHLGGIFRAPGGADEGLALLQSGERVIPKHLVDREGDRGASVNLAVTINNPTQRSNRESIALADAASRRMVRRIGVV